jgi:hypothetical protein
MTRRGFQSVLANLLWLPALAVGALQMYDVQAGALTSYGADFFGPIALYASCRVHGTVLRWFMSKPPSPGASAAIVLTGCILWELCQRFDFSGTPLAITAGRFDPGDIAAYLLGVALAFGTEKLLSRASSPAPAN